jgi:hypothetical protein
MESFDSEIAQELTRRERVNLILKELDALPLAHCGLEAFSQISETINNFEDRFWGRESWNPPRSFLDGVETKRFYTIMTESFFPVEGFPGVTLLLGTKELIFVSRYGAIEIQSKDVSDPYGKITAFWLRRNQVFFSKPDAYGHSVWDDKNRI